MVTKEEIIESLEEKGEWYGKIPIEFIEGISPYNARKHKIEENIDQLETSIGITKEIREALTLNQDFQVTKGQRRYRIAKDWNFKELPVIVRKYSDRLDELADSYVENELTYQLSSEDKEDTIYTLAKEWGEKKTSEVLGISIAGVSNIVRLREAPREIKEVLKGQSPKTIKQTLGILKKIYKEEGPEEVIKKGSYFMKMSDLDREQARKDYTTGEPVNLPKRVKEKDEYLLTIRLPRKLSSHLSRFAIKLKKDKLFLIRDILQQWVDEHKSLLET